MARTKTVGDLGIPLLVGLIIGLVVGGTVCLLWGLENSWKKESARYREAFFLTLALRVEEVNRAHEEVEAAIEAGNFVRAVIKIPDGAAQDIVNREPVGTQATLEALVRMSLLEFRKKLIDLKKLSASERTQLELQDPKLFSPLIKLVDDWRWMSENNRNHLGIIHDKKTFSLIELIIKEESEIPSFDYSYPAVPPLVLWLWLILTQCIACFFFFFWDDTRWYALPWRSPWTYTMLLFAMPTVFAFFFFGLVVSASSEEFRAYFKDGGGNGSTKRSRTQSRPTQRLPSISSVESTEFLNSLRKRLERS